MVQPNSQQSRAKEDWQLSARAALTCWIRLYGLSLTGTSRRTISRSLVLTVARWMVHFFSKPHPGPDLALSELTEREREILNFIACGETNAEIAQRLVLSPHTVRNHISNIFSKLHDADRVEVIIRARDTGLGQNLI